MLNIIENVLIFLIISIGIYAVLNHHHWDKIVKNKILTSLDFVFCVVVLLLFFRKSIPAFPAIEKQSVTLIILVIATIKLSIFSIQISKFEHTENEVNKLKKKEEEEIEEKILLAKIAERENSKTKSIEKGGMQEKEFQQMLLNAAFRKIKLYEWVIFLIIFSIGFLSVVLIEYFRFGLAFVIISIYYLFIKSKNYKNELIKKAKEN